MRNMEKSVVAFAPGHISGYFRRVDGVSAKDTGSLGAGLVTDRGVYVKMRAASKTTVKINGREADGWLIKKVLDKRHAAVEVTTELPIGAGFGMSAAGLLAGFYAANEVFSLGMTATEISEAAHEIEVNCGTGLGDVAAESCGGIVVRTRPGIAGVESRIFSDEVFYAVSFGEINTADVITSSEMMKRVSDAFPMRKPESVEEFMDNSLAFTLNSGLATDDVAKVLNACKEAGVRAAMTMLGRGVFACGAGAYNVLSRFGVPFTLKVNKTGPYVMEVV